MAIDVSVIVVNYNTLKMTSECLDSIIEKTHDVNYEIIIVDNGSTDGSKEYFAQDKRITYIYSEKNLGFGRANNLGYNYSSGRNIFLLNSDTILINNAVKILSDFLDENKSCSICGGQLYDNKNNIIHSYMHLMPSVYYEFDLLIGGRILRFLENKARKNNKNNQVFKVAYVTGADMMLRKTDIVRCGLFDPDFFLYFEETELQYRYKKKGCGECYIVTSAKITHLEGGSSKPNDNKWRIIWDSRKLYYSKCRTITEYKFSNLLWVLRLVKSKIWRKIVGPKWLYKEISDELKKVLKYSYGKDFICKNTSNEI